LTIREHVAKILIRGITQVERHAFASNPELLTTLKEREAILYVAEQLDELERQINGLKARPFTERY